MAGGEACGLSAAASIIGIGSDIGGSIRMPAFFNGVFGHKATTGLSACLPVFLYPCLSVCLLSIGLAVSLSSVCPYICFRTGHRPEKLTVYLITPGILM